MTEHAGVRRVSGLGRAPVEPLSPQAWQRVEASVFARLEAAAVPWSLAPAPRSSFVARPDRALHLHWTTSVGLALASAAAVSALHLFRSPSGVEAGLPAELVVPARSGALLRPASTPAAQPPASGPATSPAVTAQLAPPSRGVQLAAPPLVSSSPARRTRGEAPRAAASSDSRERLFERAALLESADARQALELYLSLATGADAWAANALYAAARLEVDRGLLDAGSEHLHEYLARFADGENAVDVRGLLRRIGKEP